MNELVVITPEPTQEYVSLVSHIANLWEDARNNAITAVNESLLKASWETGQYIVEFEQEGNAKARYGERLLVNLFKDLTRLRGRGFSRSNLTYMRKFYLAFPKCETISHKLTWSHYCELLPLNNINVMKYYIKISIEQNLSKRELRNKIKNMEYERLDECTKNKLIENKEHEIQDFIKNPILIKSKLNYTEISEKVLQKLIIEDIETIMKELGNSFCFIGSEYRI